MEDIEIEYLDEYKDFVLPGIKTNDARSTAASTEQASSRMRKSRCVSSDSSDSSSIDPDIFSKLFDGKFLDDELLNDSGSNQKEKSRRRLSSTSNDSTDALDALYNRQSSKSKDKRRNRQDSFDSIDDLGEALMGTTPNLILQKFTGNQIAPKKSQNNSIIKNSKLDVYKPSSSTVSKQKIKTDNFRHVSRSNNRISSSSSSNFSQLCNKKKPATILKSHKANFKPSKYEPKEDPLDLQDSSDEMDSDSSYEFESDFYGDGDTDEEDTAGPTFVINTSSESDTVSPVISEDEEGGSQHHNNEQLHLYLNNLSNAETPPSIFNENTSTNSSQKQVNDTASQALAEAEEPSSSTSSNHYLKDSETAAQDDFVDSSLTYDRIERSTIDITEQINNMDAELSFEFEKRSASKPRSHSYSTGLSHVRKLNYSNTSALRRTKSETAFPKRGRGRPPKKRNNTTEEPTKLDTHTPKKKVETPKENPNNESNIESHLEPGSPIKKKTKKRGRPRKRKNITKSTVSDNSTDHTSDVPLYIMKKRGSDVKVLNKRILDESDLPAEMTPTKTILSEGLNKSQEPVTVTSVEEEINELSCVREELAGNLQEAKSAFERKESIEKLAETSAEQCLKEISSINTTIESVVKLTDARTDDTDKMTEMSYEIENRPALDIEEKLAQMEFGIDWCKMIRTVELRTEEQSTDEVAVSPTKQTEEINEELNKIETTTNINSEITSDVKSKSEIVLQMTDERDNTAEMEQFATNTVEKEITHAIEKCDIEEQDAQIESGVELSKISDSVNIVEEKDIENSTGGADVPLIKEEKEDNIDENTKENIAKETATTENTFSEKDTNKIDAVEKPEICENDDDPVEANKNQISSNEPMTKKAEKQREPTDKNSNMEELSATIALQTNLPVKSAKPKQLSKLSTPEVIRKTLRSSTPMSSSNSDHVSDAEATASMRRNLKRKYTKIDKLVADSNLSEPNIPRICPSSSTDSESRTDAKKKLGKKSNAPKMQNVETAIEENSSLLKVSEIEIKLSAPELSKEVDETVENLVQNENIESSASNVEHLKSDVVQSTEISETNKELNIDGQDVNKLDSTSDSKLQNEVPFTLDKDRASDSKDSMESNETDVKIAPKKTPSKSLKKYVTKKQKILKSKDSAENNGDGDSTVLPKTVKDNKKANVEPEEIKEEKCEDQNTLQEAVADIKESIKPTIESTTKLDASNVDIKENETITKEELITNEVGNKDRKTAFEAPPADRKMEKPAKEQKSKPHARKSYIQRHLEEFKEHGLEICSSRSRSTRSKTKTPDVTVGRRVLIKRELKEKFVSEKPSPKPKKVKEIPHNVAHESSATTEVKQVVTYDTKEHKNDKGNEALSATKPATETALLPTSKNESSAAVSNTNAQLLSQCRKLRVRVKRFNMASLGYLQESGIENQATECTHQQMDISSEVCKESENTANMDVADKAENTDVINHTSEKSAVPSNTEMSLVTQDNRSETVRDSTEPPTNHTALLPSVDQLVTEEVVKSAEDRETDKYLTDEQINKCNSLSTMEVAHTELAEESGIINQPQPEDPLECEKTIMDEVHKDNSAELDNSADHEQQKSKPLGTKVAEKDSDNASPEETDHINQSIFNETTGVTTSVDNDSDKGDNNSVSLARALRQREADATESDELAKSKAMSQRRQGNPIHVMAPPAPPKRELPTGKSVLRRLGKDAQGPQQKRRKISDSPVDDGDVNTHDKMDNLSPTPMKAKGRTKSTTKTAKKSLRKETARDTNPSPTGSPVTGKLNVQKESPVKSKLSALLGSENPLAVDNSVIITKTPISNPTESATKAEVHPPASTAAGINISIVVVKDKVNNTNKKSIMSPSKTITPPTTVKKLSASKRIAESPTTASPVDVKKSLPVAEPGKKLNSHKKETAVEKQLSLMAKKGENSVAAAGSQTPVESRKKSEENLAKASNIVTRKSRQGQTKEALATPSAAKPEQSGNDAKLNEKSDAQKLASKMPRKITTKSKESPKIAATTEESATSSTMSEIIKTNAIESQKASNDYAKRFALSKLSELPASPSNSVSHAVLAAEPQQLQSTQRLTDLVSKPQRQPRRGLKSAANLKVPTDKCPPQLPVEKSVIKEPPSPALSILSPAKQSSQQLTQQSMPQLAKESSQQPSEQANQKPAKQPQQPTKQLTKKPSQQLVKESSQQATEQVGQRPVKQPNQRSSKQPKQQPAEQLIQQQPTKEQSLVSSTSKRKLSDEEAISSKRAKGRPSAPVAFPVRIIAASETAQNVLAADAPQKQMPAPPTPEVLSVKKETPKSNGLKITPQVLPGKQKKCCVRLNRSVVRKWLEEGQPILRTQAEQMYTAVASTAMPTMSTVINAKATVATTINRAAMEQQQQVKSVPLPLPLIEVKTEVPDIEMNDQQQQPTVPPAVALQPHTSAAPQAVPMDFGIVDALPPLVAASSDSNNTMQLSSTPNNNNSLTTSSAVSLASSSIDTNAFGITRMFSFLHPSRYHQSYGNVGLDFCCPNLDGPMPAIDPTRLHTKIEVPVLELPQYMVISTRIISRKDNYIPPKVRAKLEELSAKDALPNVMKEALSTITTATASSKPAVVQPVGTPAPIPALIPSTTPGSTTVPAPDVSLPSVIAKLSNIDRLNQQLARGTTHIPKLAPISVAGAAPAATGPAKVPSFVPSLLQLPPIMPSDKKRVELQSRVQLLDVIVQNLSRQAASLNIAQRKSVIDNIVRTSNMLPIDVDMVTKFLKNYTYYITEVTKRNVPPMPRLRPIATPTTTSTTNATPTNSAQSKPSPHASSVAPTINTTTSANTSEPRRDGSQPCRRIFDSNNQVIGYQYKTPRISLNKTATSSGAINSGTPTLAASQQQQTRLQFGPSTRTDYTVSVNPSNNKLTVIPAPTTTASVATRTSMRLVNANGSSLDSSRNPTGIIGKVETTITASNSPGNKTTPSAVESLTSNERRTDCNLFIVNQMLSQPEECILPDVSTTDTSALAAVIKGEVDDAENLT